MLARDCFEKALRGPAVHRLYAVFWRKRGDAQLLAKKAEAERRHNELSAALDAALEETQAALGILKTCRNVRFLAVRGRVRARVSWPAAHWIRT